MNLFGLWRLNCSVCVSWTRPSALSRDSRGKYIFPPISYSVPGFHFPRVAPLPPAAANSSPPASRAAAEGLRSAAFTFVAPAPRCPLRLPPNCAVRSHPLRGAYRALPAGSSAALFYIPGIMQPYRFPIKHSRIRDVGKLPPVRIFFHKMSFLIQIMYLKYTSFCFIIIIP